MDALLDPCPGAFALLIAPRPEASRLMLALAARLAQQGPLRLLDGSGRLDVYGLVRSLYAGAPEPQQTLERIQIGRAFTFRQMLSLLENTPPGPPLLVFDLLAVFAGDEPFGEALVLQACLARLEGLSRATPLAVSAAPRPAQPPAYLQRLAARAGQVLRLELPPPPAQQARFW
jgi:hypothetical protein